MYQVPPSSAKPPRAAFVGNFTQQNQKYATGNRVYNGFSPSPHAGGGLDKAGYAERDNVARTTKRNMLQQIAKKGP